MQIDFLLEGLLYPIDGAFPTTTFYMTQMKIPCVFVIHATITTAVHRFDEQNKNN
jgi:hypothetical protein